MNQIFGLWRFPFYNSHPFIAQSEISSSLYVLRCLLYADKPAHRALAAINVIFSLFVMKHSNVTAVFPSSNFMTL